MNIFFFQVSPIKPVHNSLFYHDCVEPFFRNTAVHVQLSSGLDDIFGLHFHICLFFVNLRHHYLRARLMLSLHYCFFKIGLITHQYLSLIVLAGYLRSGSFPHCVIVVLRSVIMAFYGHTHLLFYSNH